MKKHFISNDSPGYFLCLGALLGAVFWLAAPAGPTPGGRGNSSAQIATPERIKELQLAERDILGESELAKKDDPSFESAAALLPPLKRPREVVGVKYHSHDIGVASDAGLELSDDVDAAGSPKAFFEAGDPPRRFGAPPAGCAKSLLQGFLPVVLASSVSDGLRYRQKVFGWSEGLNPERDLWAYIEFTAENPGRDKRSVQVRFVVQPAADLNPSKSWSWTLQPGAAKNVRLRVPFDIRRAKFEEVAEAEYESRLGEVVRFWSEDLARGMTLDVPERRVNEAYKAWLAYASLDVDKRNGILEPHDGAGFYEQVYGYSAALYPQALDLWGRHGEARAVLESLLSLQAPDGLFTANFGTPDPGTLLLSIWEHYALSGDKAWLSVQVPKMTKMADWIIRMRKESMIVVGGKKPVTYGLIKFRPYCDHLEPTFDYFGDTYCAVGLEAAARALAAAGLADEARRIGGEAEAYRRDILASMDAAAVERDGMTILPMEPDTHRLLMGSSYRAWGYYGLISSCMLESGFLPVKDKRATWVTRFLEAKGGLRLGLTEFDGGADHAYSYGYWKNALERDQAKRAILGFYASLACGMSRETYSGVEVTKLFTGENDPTLPHLYSCTQQLRLLRMMLVREAGDDLWIGQALPRPWLRAGGKVEVGNAPTRFGPMSFTIGSFLDRGRVQVDLTAPSVAPPRRILIRLRHPDGREIAGAAVDGKPIKTFSGETISLDRPQGRMRVTVSY